MFLIKEDAGQGRGAITTDCSLYSARAVLLKNCVSCGGGRGSKRDEMKGIDRPFPQGERRDREKYL